MTFSEYQKSATETAVYPNIGFNVEYPTLGLAGETGEVCNKVKKIQRDFDGFVDDEMRESLKDEISDCMWYLAQLCTELQLDLDEVASHNLRKLQDRKNRNVIQGSGDRR